MSSELRSRNLFELLSDNESDNDYTVNKPTVAGKVKSIATKSGIVNNSTIVGSANRQIRPRIDPKSLIVNKRNNTNQHSIKKSLDKDNRKNNTDGNVDSRIPRNRSRDFNNGKKRGHDRRSGTGKRDTEKAVQQGWGDPIKDQLEIVDENTNKEEKEEKVASNENSNNIYEVDNELKENEEEDNKSEENKKQEAPSSKMTYKEYLAQKALKSLNLKTNNEQNNESMKPETPLDPKYANAQPVEKKVEEDYKLFGVRHENKKREVREKQLKPLLDITQRFTSPINSRRVFNEDADILRYKYEYTGNRNTGRRDNRNNNNNEGDGYNRNNTRDRKPISNRNDDDKDKSFNKSNDGFNRNNNNKNQGPSFNNKSRNNNDRNKKNEEAFPALVSSIKSNNQNAIQQQ